jgi:hypothetical protein
MYLINYLLWAPQRQIFISMTVDIVEFGKVEVDSQTYPGLLQTSKRASRQLTFVTWLPETGPRAPRWLLGSVKVIYNNGKQKFSACGFFSKACSSSGERRENEARERLLALRLPHQILL